MSSTAHLYIRASISRLADGVTQATTGGSTVVQISLRWRHNGHDGVSNHQPHHCLLNRLFRCRSKRTSKLRVTGLCAGNSPVTGEFPAQMTSNAENVSIWWRHHVSFTEPEILQWYASNSTFLIYPRPVLAFGYCHRLRLCVCLSVCVSFNDELYSAITCHPFKLESPNVHQKCKTPWFKVKLNWQ